MYSPNAKSKGYVLVTNTNSKFGKGKSGKYGKSSKGKVGKGSSVVLVNLSDPKGGCPNGSEIKLCHTATNTCIQTVEVSEHTCSCSLSIPPEDVPNNYCIKVVAAGYTCSGSFGNSCIQYLDSVQSKFCVQLTPVRASNGYNPVGNALFSTSTVTFHQTQVIVVTASDQTCMSDAIVEVSDCGTRESLGTFTTTSENCATSFALPTSKTHYCMNVFAANYTCSGNISSDCSSGPIAVPDNNPNGTTYEVIMKSVLGTVELHLNASESIYKELSETSIMYSLINHNGQVDETKISDSYGVTFPNLAAGAYSISYQAIPGYTCGGNLLEENRCTTETVSCMSNSKTIITYNIEKIKPKPTNKPASFQTTPSKNAVVISVINGELPTSGVQVSIVAAGKPNDIVDTCTTSVNGKCFFTPESSEVSFAATITPPKGTTCQDSCTIEMILKPGQNLEYTIVLVPSESTAIVIVIMDKKPVPGVHVDYFISGSPDNIVETSTTTAEGKSTFIAEDSTMEYTAKVTPPEGMKCQGSCTFEMTMKPGETAEYNVVLALAPSTAIVYVVESDKPVPGVLVEYFITGSPDEIIGANTTTADGRSTFSSEGPAMEYTAKVTPPEGMKCQDSCIVEVTMKPGEYLEYKVVLIPSQKMAIVKVIMDDKPISGVKVDYSIAASPDKIIGTSSTTLEGESNFSSDSAEIGYTASVTPPEGTTCQNSCTIDVTLKLGGIAEYTVVLVPTKSTAKVNVVKDNRPVPDVKVNYFVTGEPNQIIGSETTTTEGKSTFSFEGAEASITAVATPPEGTSCQESCSVIMTLTPGETSEYTVLLTDEAATLIIQVEHKGESVAGAQVSFSIQNNLEKMLEACTMSKSIKECELTVKSNFDAQYLSTVIPPAGYICPETGCTAGFTMVPGKTLDYTFSLIKEIVPTGEAIVSVLYSGVCLEGAKVEIFDANHTATPLQSFTTTSSVCNMTFTTVNLNVVYRAIVTPPIGPYLCSGSFDSSCSATFKVVVAQVTIVQCILVIITQPPVTFSPTQNPAIPPTPKPTNKPTVLPVKPPTEKPTMKPTKLPAMLPTLKPTNKPTVLPVKPPTEKPTMKPTKLPAILPTPKPTNKPTVLPVKPPTEKPTMKPTKLPAMLPTPKPTNKPTVLPVKPPTEKPTMKPTKLPAIPPTNKPTMLPVKPPTEKPTTKPTKLPVDPPTLTPWPLQSESTTMPPTKNPVVSPTSQSTKGPVLTSTKNPSTMLPVQKESATMVPTPNKVNPVMSKSTKKPKTLQTTQATVSPVKGGKSTKSPFKSRPPSSSKSKATIPTDKPVSSTVLQPTRKVGATISNDYTVKIKGK